MRSRPNNYIKNFVRTKSPVLLTSHPIITSEGRLQDKNNIMAKQDNRIGSADIKLRMVSPEAPKTMKKNQQKSDVIK